LVERSGDLIGKGELMARIWPDTFVEEGNLKVHIAALHPPLCCTDQHPLSFEANVLRPPKLQHAVQRGDSNDHLGRLPPFGPRAAGHR
jgi:hypothetical protein